MFVLKLAFRNLRRQKRRTFFTGLMMAGGFFLCSVFLGMAEGSYNSIIDFFTQDHTGHVQIHRQGYLDNPSLQLTLEGWDKLQKEIQSDPLVVSASPRVYAATLAFTGPKTTGARLVGLDADLEVKTTRFKNKVVQGGFFPAGGKNAVLVGDGVAQALQLKPGSELALVSQGADGSIANDLFKVAGIVGGGGQAGLDRNIYLRLSDAQSFLSLGNRFHEVAIRLKDIRKAERAARALSQKLGDPKLDVEPWQVVEKDFYRAMQADKAGGNISQVIFMLLVALGVLNTVLMNTLERIPEYGLLKALGTRPSTLTAVILCEMTLLSLLSLIPGFGLSWAANAYLAGVGWPLPHPFTYGGMVFTTMYGEVSWQVFLLPAALVVLMAFLVSLPAAWRIRKLTAIEALRKA